MNDLPQNPWVLFLILSSGLLLSYILSVLKFRQRLEKAEQDALQQRDLIQDQQLQNAVQEQQLEQLKSALEQARTEQQQAEISQQQALEKIRQTEMQWQEARTQLLHTERYNKQMREELDQNRKVMRQEFENLANNILKSSRDDFQLQSKEQLGSFLKPFREQVQDFRQRVDVLHNEELQKQTELKTQIESLQKQSLQISQDANELATALKGQKKMQGNWGELILENVLDRSGLRAGIDYQRESSFNTESGRKRPDVIITLPQGKHLVIDSKLSLNAYTRYINSEDENERELAIREHIQAVRSRIQELSDKDYFDLPGLHSPEMVFMFIPIESAFVEAMKYDQPLFQQAIDQNILVATPTTLLTSLNIVSQLWRFENQNRHSAELADRARKVYEKLSNFIQSMDGLGRSLDSAQKAYQKAYGQLYSGKGNLIKQASEFKELGVAVKNELPPELLDKADLELELDPSERE